MTCARSLIIRFSPTCNAAAGERVDFGQEAGRIDHDPGRDDALHLGPEDAAGHQGELEGLAPADDGMTRRWSRPGSGPRCRAVRSTGQRSCPWPRRPIAIQLHRSPALAASSKRQCSVQTPHFRAQSGRGQGPRLAAHDARGPAEPRHRRGKQQGIDDIQHAAEAGKPVAGVFSAHVAFQERFGQVAKHARPAN